MANDYRLRTNGLFGFVETNFDTLSTTLVSGALVAAPAVDSTSHLDVTLYNEDAATPEFEVVRIISHAASSNTATVLRGIHGTVRSWAPGTRLVHAPTTDDFDHRLDVIERRLGSEPHVLDDEFTDENYSGWTEVHLNAVAVTTIEKAGVLSIYSPGGDATTQASHNWLKEIPALTFPFSVQIGARMMRRYATNYQMFGPIMTNGLLSTSACVWMMPYASTSTAAAHTFSTRYGTLASVGTDSGSLTFEHVGSILHMRLTAVSSTFWRAEYSPDGVSWIQYPVADFIYGITPTHVGFALGSWSVTTPMIATVEYFRVIQ
jgi:hypothetical protein